MDVPCARSIIADRLAGHRRGQSTAHRASRIPHKTVGYHESSGAKIQYRDSIQAEVRRHSSAVLRIGAWWGVTISHQGKCGAIMEEKKQTNVRTEAQRRARK